jgi:hypothetical protein
MFDFFKTINKILKILFPIFMVVARSNYLFKKHYRNKPKNVPIKSKKRTIIFMLDGVLDIATRSGLVDRFRGMTMLYKVSKILDTDFKINFTSPQNLSCFLVPNKHNWLIEEKDICYSAKYSIICNGIFSTDHSWMEHSEKTKLNDILTEVKKFLPKYQQIHAYTNCCVSDNDYPLLFEELFKPSVELQKSIEENMNKIGNDFISATFRFQQLLGDFVEGQFPVLNKEERSFLLEKCLEHLLEIHTENIGKKILVTSDSVTFLNAVKRFDFVYIVPGRVIHMNNVLETDINILMKSFVDYFMISNAKKVYLVIDGEMYDSGFAYRASLHNKVPYIIKKYN